MTMSTATTTMRIAIYIKGPYIHFFFEVVGHFVGLFVVVVVVVETKYSSESKLLVVLLLSFG